MPQISVLMSVYNGEKFLKEAIKSVLSQTFSDFEFIISNDVSTDSSLEIINSFKDKRIRLIQNEKRLELTKSLNKGLKIASGKYIARIDADDICREDRLEKQFNFMETNSNVTVCGSYANLIDDNGYKIGELKHHVDFESIKGKIFFDNILIHSSAFFIKDFIHKIGMYNEEFTRSQDYELWFRVIANNGEITNIPENLIDFRVHSNNIASSIKATNLTQEEFSCMAIQKGIKEILDFDTDLDAIKSYRSLRYGYEYKRNYKKMFELFKLLKLNSQKVFGTSSLSTVELSNVINETINKSFITKILNKIY